MWMSRQKSMIDGILQEHNIYTKWTEDSLMFP